MFILLAAKKHINKGIMAQITVRQPNSLTALINPPDTAQNFAHPNIGGAAAVLDTSDSPLTIAQMDTNWQSVYPVGSIYINATDASNPADLIGFGTWEAFGKGRVLLGHASNNSPSDSPSIMQTITSVDGPISIGGVQQLGINFKHTHEYPVGARITLSGINTTSGDANKEWYVATRGGLGGQAADKSVTVIINSPPGIGAASLGTDPKARFGGTAFDGAGTGFSNTVGYEGNISHKLTIDEMPKHQHQTINFTSRDNNKGRWTTTSAKPAAYTWSIRNAGSDFDKLDFQGGDAAHNNLQPYITAYIWRRTA